MRQLNLKQKLKKNVRTLLVNKLENQNFIKRE